jgi:AcrR family transcriptional regulator
MDTPDWNNLILLEDWAETLETLLAAAKAAIRGSEADREEVSRLLRTFVEKSPFNAKKLDDIATNSIISLNIADIEAALREIATRDDELQAQLAIIQAATDHAQADIKKLRLDQVNKTLATARTALKALQKANKALKSPDAALTVKIDAIVQAIDDLG